MATRDEYSDTERAPADTVHHKKSAEFTDAYEMNVSTIADEFHGDGWVQRTRPYGGCNPIETSGTAGAVDDKQIDEYNAAARSQSGYSQ